MWAAIAVSGLIIASWVMSLGLHVSFQTAAPQIDARGAFLLISDGCCSLVQLRYRTPVPAGWHIRRAQAHPGSYGFTLPAAHRETWGGYSWLLPLWIPLLVSAGAAGAPVAIRSARARRPLPEVRLRPDRQRQRAVSGMRVEVKILGKQSWETTMPRPYLPIAAGFICLPVVLYSVAAPQGEQRDFSSEPTSTAKSDVPASQPAPPTSSAYADLFSRLREALVHPRPTRHPRVPDEVMTLICAREDATGAICAEADRAGSDPANETYLAQLYFILGFVKDVQSVPWVAGKLKTPQQRYVVRDWLDGWLAVAPLAYYMEHPAEWEQVSGTWAEFFRQLMASDVTPAQRARFVLAMTLWFYDAATSESVSRLVSSSDAKPVEKTARRLLPARARPAG